MVSTWDARDDFGGVVDTLETVTLCRRGGGTDEQLQGWRFRQESTNPYGTGGALTVTDVTWQLAFVPGGAEPKPGDTLRSASGVCGAIRSVRRMRGATRWVGVARSVELSPLLAERLSLERPVYGNTTTPEVVTDWRVVRPHVVAWIDRATLDQEPAVGEKDSVSVIAYLPRAIEVRRGERLLSDRGEVYQVDSVDGQAGYGDPFVIQLRVAG